MNQIDIINYIPQRAPFVMVGEVLQADEKLYKTKLVISDDNIFTIDGEFTEPGLVENMAQTAAAGMGYRYHEMGEVVPVGFIASIKALKIEALPKTEDELITEVAIINKIMNVHVVQAKAMVGENVVASCEMKIFEQSEK